MVKSDSRGEQNQLDGFRASEPKPGEEAEPRHVPVDDNNEPDPPPPPDRPAAEKREEPTTPPPAKKPAMPPADEARLRLGERFAKKRAGETLEYDGDINSDQTRYGTLGANEQPERDEPAPKPQDSPGPVDTGDKLTLKVNGKDRAMSIEEIAVKADMSVEEVRADPERAKRYAQKEIATDERLETARRLTREARERATNPESDQPRSPAPNQERKQAGSRDTDDGSESDDRDTSEVDFKGLVDELQVGTPEEVAGKLEQAVERVAEKVATRRLSESETERRVMADGDTIRRGMLDFVAEHPEVKGNEEVGPLMKGSLVLEYRKDLLNALVHSDGLDEDEAREALRGKSEAAIMDAHQYRRIHGDPNVRRVDKTFFNAAYERLRSPGSTGSNEQRQDPLQQRRERKENLPPQPRRASVPQTPPQTPPTQAVSRKAAVAQMARARGQRAP